MAVKEQNWMKLSFPEKARQWKALLSRATIALSLFILLLWSGSAWGPLSLAAGRAAPPPPREMPGRFAVLWFDPNAPSIHVPPPPELSALRVQNATLNVQFLTAGQTDLWGYTCLDWPDDAKAAYLYATNIWAALIHSSVPINIVACWADLGSDGILGLGGPYTIERDFPNAPYANTWYPVALANALAGSDQNGADPEITGTYNMNFRWYFGTDGNPPSDRVDFVTVVLHEIGHGLGFLGTMEVLDNGQGRWGFGLPYPYAYDRFTEDGAGNALLNTSVYPNPSTALASALTSGNVWFDGPNARRANGGQRVRIYAPSTWDSGSSYSHLDSATYEGTPNALMTPYLSDGTAIHDPGAVTRGILSDLGWEIGLPDLSPSTKSVTPDQATSGQVVTFTVRLVNSGDASATVRFTDTLPSTLQPVGSPTASSGSPPSVNGQTITWQGVVADSGVVTITYATRLTTDGVAVNRAQIDNSIGNIYTRWALVNGYRTFLPLTLRSTGP